ncbi:MAG: GNAT family N-acetyltransferase [Chloroflexi bacterium]|nr:GNAT family N-acetyltransferase [Chloroflexota bacterium]
MPIRLIKLPNDFDAVIDLTINCFQYPENETWSVQSDDQENIVDMFKSIQRLWPLIRLFQVVVPTLRDLLHGLIWEEDGRPVGMIFLQRQKTTDTWHIGNVAVLPEYRRRGIARRLVEDGLALIREHGGRMALLDVIAGNVPAYTLYKRLGFEHYNSRFEFNYLQDTPLPEQPLPDAYKSSALKLLDWRPSFELGRRIVPADVRKYEPVTEAHYKTGPAGPLFLGIMKLGGIKAARIMVQTREDEKIVAVASYRIRKRAGGVNGISLQVDPGHSEVAPYLLSFLINTVLRLSPGRRIEFDVPGWQSKVLEIVAETPCTKRYEYHSMGAAL